ncbi:ImmA/IrrE family metallo-endopeptidase [Clostridium sp. D2Q-14]|uniref:ImmA/IrrE family metallo-endopeptidase n=1 Tax=Anaeromonas gelatinilytica TaxID=2683194 RepID=UPI00193B11DC|nr:ImmA/IrrE family metallo-endopeptidase [Anaeromonas gelatinilytica]MBS4535181.1 ImmA/IrrE family metallo-endopeptidase [Anaeromonas gelatinilytica]
MTLADLLPKQHINYLQDKANEILGINKINKIYDINLDIIIEKYKNIKVINLNQDSKTILKRNKAIIIINNNLDYREYRQELAEEFCHALLHIGNQINYSKNVCLTKQENQAKRMSAYLLCPIKFISNIDIYDNTYALVEELADLFNVTYNFMQYRLSLIWGQDIDYIAFNKGQAYGYISVE